MYGTRLPELRTATEKTVNKPKRKRRKPRTFIIFGFAEDTLPRKKCKLACIFSRLIRTLALPKIFSLGKMQVNLFLPSLIRTLASPKILSLGKMQVNLLLPSLIRIFIIHPCKKGGVYGKAVLFRL
ncbi:MAG: hypothetical protein EGS50_11500 [Alistipes senegalensis]|nr:hypothetical protein [Alistipes senegalensis]